MEITSQSDFILQDKWWRFDWIELLVQGGREVGMDGAGHGAWLGAGLACGRRTGIDGLDGISWSSDR